ncbi:hypothetical protein SLS55_001989 [Diplodia seriata]|uniref:Uncharacterized protein n=1 Tax=Diplodia seriata TaxID=420778 RepID=A0ABR3CQZ4_9PEZI
MNGLPLVSNKDFTVHIEPDWDYDANTCLVVYRFKGRIIHRLNPRQVDLALARQQLVAAVAGPGWFQAAAKDDTDTQRSDSSSGEDPPYHAPTKYCLVPFDEFHGSIVIDPEERLADMADNATDPPGYIFTPLMINVSGSSNALLCMASMYEGWTGSSRVRVIRTKSDFENAIQSFAKVLIVFRG